MKRGVKTIIVGVLLLLTAVIAIPLAIFLVIGFGIAKGQEFKVPGSMTTTVEKPGKYVLWDDFHTVYEGKIYNASDSLPDGMKIQVLDAEEHPIRFMSDEAISVSGSGTTKRSIGYVELASAGKVSVEVTGSNEERIFSFKRSNARKDIGEIVGGVGVAVVLGLAGVVFVIWGIVKLSKGPKAGDIAA